MRNFLSGAGSSTRHRFSECSTSLEHTATATRRSSKRRIEVVLVVSWWHAVLLVLNQIMLRLFKFTRERLPDSIMGCLMSAKEGKFR